VKADILHGKKKFRIEDVAPPALKPGEVCIRIEAALSCGMDLKVFKRGYHVKMMVPPPSSAMNSPAQSRSWELAVQSWGGGNRRPCGRGQFRAVRRLFSLPRRSGKSL